MSDLVSTVLTVERCDRPTVTHAYRFALDPTPRQVGALLAHAGAARVAFNWGLAQVKANLGQREAERTYGTAERDLTPAFGWSMYSMRKAWNQAKEDVAPWWAENSKEAYATGLDNLARALKNWSDSRKGKRAGPRMAFPCFKSKRNATASCRFTTGVIRLEESRHHVTLPVLGTIKTHESTRKLYLRVVDGTAVVRSATVKLEAGRWFVSFSVRVDHVERTPARPDAVVGVDLGIRTLAVFSDGRSAVPNPKHHDSARRKLARLSRALSRKTGPDRRSKQKPSNRWLRANNQRNRVHHRVVHLRRDGIHKLTTSLAREYGTIVLEDLHVVGMLRNQNLARSIADAGFGEIRRQLAYKTQWNGGRLIVADRWFPSSKTCSGCQAVKTKLPLRARVYACAPCGLVLDRDKNAAINLAALVKQHVAGSGPETENGRGADRKTEPSSAGGCEASTLHRTSSAPGGTRTFGQQWAND